MTARRGLVFIASCLALQGSVFLGLAIAARMGCQPTTFVVGLAFSFVPYAGLLIGARSLSPLGTARLLALAFAFGAPLVFAPPLLSDDLYRYLWEGRLWLEGFNPYQLAPDDVTLGPLRDELWPNINNRSLGSIYPPVSQVLFVVAASLGAKVWTVKLLALLGHGLAVAVFARIAPSPRASAALALNPLLLSESALNGHIDILCGLALLIAACALGRHRFVRAGFATCAAVGLKVVGLVLLPLFSRRPKALLGTGLASALLLAPLVVWRTPAHPGSGAGQFAQRWRGNESLYALADWASRLLFSDHVAEIAARVMVALILLFVCALVVRRGVNPQAAARALIWAVLLLSPQVHPWYLAWLLPLELAAGGSAGLVWSAAILCAYAPLDLWVSQGVWRMPVSLQIFEYSLVALALIVDPRRPALKRAGVERQFS